jgi:hypothetical protein
MPGTEETEKPPVPKWRQMITGTELEEDIGRVEAIIQEWEERGEQRRQSDILAAMARFVPVLGSFDDYLSRAEAIGKYWGKGLRTTEATLRYRTAEITPEEIEVLRGVALDFHSLTVATELEPFIANDTLMQAVVEAALDEYNKPPISEEELQRMDNEGDRKWEKTKREWQKRGGKWRQLASEVEKFARG